MTVTIDGFKDFLYRVAEIPVEALPIDSMSIPESLDYAVAVTPSTLTVTGNSVYDRAVYLFGTSHLYRWAPDQQGLSFFKEARKAWGVRGPVSGLVSSVSDNGTTTSFSVPDWYKEATLSELSLMRDPFGREYLGILQSMGTLWGMS